MVRDRGGETKRETGQQRARRCYARSMLLTGNSTADIAGGRATVSGSVLHGRDRTSEPLTVAVHVAVKSRWATEQLCSLTQQKVLSNLDVWHLSACDEVAQVEDVVLLVAPATDMHNARVRSRRTRPPSFEVILRVCCWMRSQSMHCIISPIAYTVQSVQKINPDVES